MNNLIDQTEVSEMLEGDFKKVSHFTEENYILTDFFLLLFTKTQLLYCLLSGPYIV